MAADGSDGPDVTPEEAAAAAGGEIWGTLEELLLACAVSRHGTASWESVAMEVQTRSPHVARPGLTPHSCRLRFHHLHRRFSVAAAGAEEEGEEAEAAVGPDASAADGWVDELRRLRVAELRRDVERCDLSIGTLQSKVERLREERERERSLSGDVKPERGANGGGDERLSSEEPGRSCRESNSTDLKPPSRPGEHAVKEESAAAAVKQEASGESVAASKESSDVRSSASLCRRRKPGGADEEADGEEASAPRPAARSQPLLTLLDAVAAKFGAVFERLHESQESAEYRDTIRRHVDLDAMRCKLDTSAGSAKCYYPVSEFYRDLLLLCTNAVVFFPRAAPEHTAAADARALVYASLCEPKQEPVAAATAPAAVAGSPAAEESQRAEAGGDIVGSLIEKGGKPLIVCRKRSSIAKAAAATRKEESVEKVEEAEVEEEEEEEAGDEDGESDDVGAKKAVVASLKDKPWGSRTKKGRGGGFAKNSSVAQSRKVAKVSDDGEPIAGGGGGRKAEKRAVDTAKGAVAKKRNAADFLKRLNQGSSPSKKASTLGTRKRAAAATEQQKARKGSDRKQEGTGRGGPRRGSKTGTTKRSVGRPAKRGAASLTPPPSKRAKVSRSEKPSSSSLSRRGGRR